MGSREGQDGGAIEIGVEDRAKDQTRGFWQGEIKWL